MAADLLDKASMLQQRSNRAYSSLFHRQKGFMVPKLRSGQFSTMFNSIEWGRGYTEGNAWHHSFPPYALSKASVASSKGE